MSRGLAGSGVSGRPATRRTLAVALALSVAMAAPSSARSQTLGLDVATRDLPAWMEGWSPLDRGPGELARTLPSTGGALPRLLAPAPRVGLFWGAGHVAALPEEVRTSRADFALSHGSRDGDFRRPLDAPSASAAQLSAIGWRPVGDRAAMIGRLSVVRRASEASPWRLAPDVYGPSPFAAVDSSQSGDSQSRIRLDGAAGWRVAGWGVGVGGGYETLDQRTDFAAIASGARRASVGLSAGATRRVGAVTVGLQAGWRSDAATLNASGAAVRSSPQVYELMGLRDVVAAPVEGAYYRRSDATRPSVGIALAGQGWGGRWSASAAAGHHTERHRRDPNPDVSGSEWTADGAALAAAYQRTVPFPIGAAALATVRGRAELLDGSGTLADRPGVTMYTGRDVAMGGELELRFPAVTASGGRSGAPWSAVLAVGLTQVQRQQTDSNATLHSDIQTLTPILSLEAERAVTNRLRVGGGVSMGAHLARGSIPLVRSPGIAHRELVGPAIALTGSRARPLAGSLMLRWLDGDRSYWLAGRMERVSPGEVGPDGPLPFAPDGERTVRAIVVGVTVGGG
ncbi:MAG: DUF6850 family outer membrane beta-barrel protein [Gemmatimonadaceae bacterium]